MVVYTRSYPEDIVRYFISTVPETPGFPAYLSMSDFEIVPDSDNIDVFQTYTEGSTKLDSKNLYWIDSTLSSTGSTKLPGGKTKASTPKASSKRVKVGKATRIVYVGPRGGEYVKVNGVFVAAKDATKSKAKKAATATSKKAKAKK